MTRGLIVYGCGGHGKVVADAALAQGWSVLGFADDSADRRGAAVLGLEVVCVGIDEVADMCREREAQAVVAIGDNEARRRVFAALQARGVTAATVVHPAAVIAPSARLGAGTVVFAGAVVNPAASIGQDAIVNTAASVDHDCAIGDHVHISPGARLGGTVQVGEGTHIGIGAIVRNNHAVGAWSVLGAGANAVADIPDRVVAYGNPARVIRRLDP